MVETNHAKTYLKTIVKSITIDTDEYTLDTKVQMLVNDLCQNRIQFSAHRGINTFYREWNDSHSRENDSVWIRQPSCDVLLRIGTFVMITGLHQSSLKDILNDHFTVMSWNKILLCVGKLWVNKETNSANINLEKNGIEDVPVIFESDRQACFSVEWIVQKIYISHDHITASKHDHYALRSIHNAWPNQSNFGMNRNHDIADRVTDPSQLTWCGYGWVCSEKPPIVNCGKCIFDEKHGGGTTISECKQQVWPYFKPYSIFQGYIPRLFSCRSCNETNLY